MLISYNWLREFVPNLKARPQKVAEKLSVTLAEVKTVTQKGQDYIFEIENKALTHRPDCFSHLGIAREIGAAFNLKLNRPQPSHFKLPSISKTTESFGVTIQADQLCPRYTAVVLNHLKVGPSPNWLKTALERLGIRSINNIVDITNYVMLEVGQPLHAFDRNKLATTHPQVHVGVRVAREGEEITTLDGQRRNLSAGMLVITNRNYLKKNLNGRKVSTKVNSKPIAIAGIMGGSETEVHNYTTSIILESANFNSYSIRKTSNLLGLRSEASTRFEKGLDPNLTEIGLKRAIHLMNQLAHAQIASKIVDIYPKKIRPKPIKINTKETNAFLGTKLSDRNMTTFLNSLDLETTQAGNTFNVQIPTFRQDLNIPEDLYEEIARVYGYDKIRPTLPKRTLAPALPNPEVEFDQKIRKLFVQMGFHEVYTYTFVGEKSAHNSYDHFSKLSRIHSERIQSKRRPGNALPPLQLKNPLSPDLSFLRQTLLPSLLEKAKLNQKSFDEFKLFEIDRVVHPREKGKLPEEPKHLAGILFQSNSNPQRLYPLVKGAIETLFSKLNQEAFYSPKTKDRILIHLTTGKKLKINLGHIDLIDRQTIGFEVNLSLLFKHQKGDKTFQPIPIHPPVKKDISLIIPQSVHVGDVLGRIKDRGGKLLKEVELFDIYQNEKVSGRGKKSVAFHLTFQSSKRSLADKDVRPREEKIIKDLQQKFQAQIRN